MSLIAGLTKDYEGQVDLDPSSLYTVASNPVSIYLSATAGNDNGHGSSPASPLLTPLAALANSPPLWRSSCQFIYDPAGGTYQFPASGGNLYTGKPLSGMPLSGSPMTWIGSNADVGGGPQTETSGGSVFLFTVAGTPFVASALIGAALRIISGAGAGQRGLIRANTTSTITLDAPFAVANGVGSVFQIERPNTVITWTSGTLGISAYSLLGLRDIKFVVPAGGSLTVLDWSEVYGENIEVDISATNASVRFPRNGAFQPASQPAYNINDAVNPFNFSRVTCGWYIHGGGAASTIQVNAGSQMNFGYLVLQNLGLSIGGGSNNSPATFSPAGLTALNTTWNIDQLCRVDLSGAAALGMLLDGQVAASTTTGILNYNRRSGGVLANVVVQNSGGHAIVVQETAYVEFSAGVSGSGTTVGYGIKTKNRGGVGFTTLAGAILASVTGATGAVLNGANSFANYPALFTAGGDVETTPGGSFAMLLV